ncbi:MAG: 3-dehydroquinate synthase AroB [Pseudomonadota bacterium]
MTTLRQEFSISYTYSVHFTQGLFEISNPVLREVIQEEVDPNIPFKSKIAFVVESELTRFHPALAPSIRSYCNALLPGSLSDSGILEVSGGEYSKNTPAVLQRLYDFLHDEKICRHSYVVVIGGGALIDVVGYAAATTHRGVRLIRVPTTVLAQNDAGLGVKNSINAFGKKNFIGTFAPARAIINDARFLESLPQRDWIAGVAEAIKVSLIKDPLFFTYIEKHAAELARRDMPVMQHVIRRCAQLHLDHISKGGDPFELGSSRPLDFGHWSAHKIEALSGHSIRHGEAVAIGIELDATYSHLVGFITREELCRVTAVCDSLGFSKWRGYLAMLLEGRRLEDALHEFKEHLGGVLTITLLRRIGEGGDVHEIRSDLMREAISKVMELPRTAPDPSEQAA